MKSDAVVSRGGKVKAAMQVFRWQSRRDASSGRFPGSDMFWERMISASGIPDFLLSLVHLLECVDKVDVFHEEFMVEKVFGNHTIDGKVSDGAGFNRDLIGWQKESCAVMRGYPASVDHLLELRIDVFACSLNHGVVGEELDSVETILFVSRQNDKNVVCLIGASEVAFG